MREANRPAMLPKGTYTITAEADYALDMEVVKSERLLKTSLQITIK